VVLEGEGEVGEAELVEGDVEGLVEGGEVVLFEFVVEGIFEKSVATDGLDLVDEIGGFWFDEF
jgi:hypothetical protein